MRGTTKVVLTRFQPIDTVESSSHQGISSPTTKGHLFFHINFPRHIPLNLQMHSAIFRRYCLISQCKVFALCVSATIVHKTATLQWVYTISFSIGMFACIPDHDLHGVFFFLERSATSSATVICGTLVDPILPRYMILQDGGAEDYYTFYNGL